jgi:hypothetical protein
MLQPPLIHQQPIQDPGLGEVLHHDPPEGQLLVRPLVRRTLDRPGTQRLEGLDLEPLDRCSRQEKD